MTTKNLVDLVSKKKILILPENKLDQIINIKGLKILREDNTYVCNQIRILELNEKILTLEFTLNHELSIRKFKNGKEAEEFVNDRLETYDKMWDGCGCKVDYYH